MNTNDILNKYGISPSKIINEINKNEYYKSLNISFNASETDIYPSGNNFIVYVWGIAKGSISVTISK